VFLYDLKAFDEDVHIRCTGKSNRQILENINYLDACGKKIEVRIPYVPEYNADQMEKIAAFLKPLQNVKAVKVLPYHNLAGSKYEALGMENTLPSRLPTDEELQKAEKLFA
jgi:pyruvate formate lyase activating enzyme